MEEFHSLSEYNEVEDVFSKLEEAIPLAVKLQREHGDTAGALNALRDIINKAIGTDTPPSSRASFSRALTLEQAFDKARLVYQRAKQPEEAVASGIVSYFMGAKRMAALAHNSSGLAAEQLSPQYQKEFYVNPEEAKQAAAMWNSEAKEWLDKALAAISSDAIHAEATRLLKKMKIDGAFADAILAAVSQPPDNPWEMFNAVMAALGH